jgi:hypothetical protein
LEVGGEIKESGVRSLKPGVRSQEPGVSSQGSLICKMQAVFHKAAFLEYLESLNIF